MVVKLNFVVLFPLLTSVIFCVSEEDFSILPKKYELEDPDVCSSNNGVFCKVYVTLMPENSTNPSKVWKVLEEVHNDYRYVERTKLIHGRCFKKSQLKTLNDILHHDYASKYQNDSIRGKVENFACFESGRFFLNDLDYWDLLFISIGVIYVIFLASATTYTHFTDHEKDNTLLKYVSIFSLKTIWTELRKPIKNEDFQNLKSIQGLRTLTMMLIISLHAFYGNMFTFLKNPEYLENIYINLFTRNIVIIFTFLVQTFFLISSWLLTVQLTNIIQRNGKLTFKEILVLALNRYFRLIPVCAILVIALRSNLAYDVVSYTNEDIMKREVDICRYSWWKNFLFIQNIYEPDKICSGVTWYLATDYQLYLLTLVLIYVSHNLKINGNYLVAVVIAAAVTVQVTIITKTDFQGFLRLFPKKANLEDMLMSKEFTLSYIPIWCNTATYMMGIVFGTIYSSRKNQKLFNNNLKKILWLIGFLGLPVFALFITSFPYDTRIYEIMVSVFARPIFGIGIGIGIFGMASGTGGLLKIILESEPLVFLANFCYCVYLIHYAFVFSRIMGEDKLVELSIFYIAKYTLIDYTLSFTCGGLLYIACEHPFIQLQKLLLPQVTTKKKTLEESMKTPPKTISGSSY